MKKKQKLTYNKLFRKIMAAKLLFIALLLRLNDKSALNCIYLA